MSDTIELKESQLGKQAIVCSLNRSLRFHWAKNKKIKKQYELIKRNQMSLNNVTKAIVGERFSLHIVSYRKRLLDHDNLYGAHKWLIDALCNELFIWDDDTVHLVSLKVNQQTCKETGEKEEYTLVRRTG